MKVVPAYLKVETVARLCGMEPREMRDFLRAEGVPLIRRKARGKLRVPWDALREALPAAAIRIHRYFVIDGGTN